MQLVTRSRPGLRFAAPLLTFLVVVWLAPVASLRAADTMEPFGAGHLDAEVYLGAAGLRGGRDGRQLDSELVLGYGIAERLSVFAGTSLDGPRLLAQRAGRGFGGVLATVIDRPHLDLDVGLQLGYCREDRRGVEALATAELNLDRKPDGRGWGAFARLGVPFEPEPAGTPEPPVTRVLLFATPGACITLAQRHQILVEWEVTLRRRSRGRDWMDAGGLALGYNVELTDRLELITQIHFHPGQADSPGLRVGLIAVMPRPR